jgi:predicted transcriptional regulator
MSLEFFKMSQESNDITELLITLTADIVAAHVSNNSVAVSDVSNLISNVHAALSGISGPAVVEEIALEPAVPIRNSIKRDYIVCLDDGKKLKMLKRHLMAHYGMTPDDYRAKWGSGRRLPDGRACLRRTRAASWPRRSALGARRDRAARKRL